MKAAIQERLHQLAFAEEEEGMAEEKAAEEEAVEEKAAEEEAAEEKAAEEKAEEEVEEGCLCDSDEEVANMFRLCCFLLLGIQEET